ncbi:MAG: hypothetical protein JWP74_2092 [Marmoricola sp.]|nr:hypothetical protein [Marmoricola sp.]
MEAKDEPETAAEPKTPEEIQKENAETSQEQPSEDVS